MCRLRVFAWWGTKKQTDLKVCHLCVYVHKCTLRHKGICFTYLIWQLLADKETCITTTWTLMYSVHTIKWSHTNINRCQHGTQDCCEEAWTVIVLYVGPLKGRPRCTCRCYTRSPIIQEMLQPISSLISYVCVFIVFFFRFHLEWTAATVSYTYNERCTWPCLASLFFAFWHSLSPAWSCWIGDCVAWLCLEHSCFSLFSYHT